MVGGGACRPLRPMVIVCITLPDVEWVCNVDLAFSHFLS